MNLAFKLEVKSVKVNHRPKLELPSILDKSPPHRVVWDIKQEKNIDPKKELAKQKKVLEKIAQKKKRNIQTLLDEPLPPIHELTQSTKTEKQQKDKTSSPLPQIVNKLTPYSHTTSPWSLKKTSNRLLSPNTSDCSSNEDWEECHTRSGHIKWKKSDSEVCLSPKCPEVPFELKYLRWSQKISRINFSYFQ